MQSFELCILDVEHLDIRLLKEFIEYGNNVKEEVKVTLSEIKKNVQGTVEKIKPRIKSMI